MLLDSKSIENFKESSIVDINNYAVKDAMTYVYVPGKIELLLSEDLTIEYELINTSTIKMSNWQSESSLNLVFTRDDISELPDLEGNYVLFDYSEISQFKYKEKIAIDLEADKVENVSMTLKEWLVLQKIETFEKMQEKYAFNSVLTNEKAKSNLFKKYKDSYILSLGNIKTETYLRVPKELLFITETANYEFIDHQTVLIKNGRVIIIYN